MRIIALLLGILAAAPAFAQEPAPIPKEEMTADGVRIQFGFAFTRREGDDLLWIASDVEIDAPDRAMNIRADKILLWFRTKDEKIDGKAPPKIRQFYAEGNVVYRRLNTKTSKSDTLRMAYFYYDVISKKGYFFDLQTQNYFEKTKTSIVLRAKEAKFVSEGKVEASEVVLSTCTYGDPHYHIKFKNAKLSGDKPHPPEDWWDIWPYEKQDWKFDANGVTAEIWGFPVFFWPGISITAAALSTFPIRRASMGQTSRFGTTIESDWGINLTKGMVDMFNPLDKSTDYDDKEKWGELNWEIDWRENRGWGFGIDPEWKWPGFHHGYIDSYYLRDDGPSASNEFDAKFLPLVNEDRARVRLFQRTLISPKFRFEIEASYISDRNLLEEFFEVEFKEGKEQESVAYLRYAQENAGGYILERNRLNDFQTQVEFLPRVRYYRFDDPVVTGLTYSQEAEVVRLRQRFDEIITGVDEADTARLDTLNTLVYSAVLGPVVISPFAEARLTWYQNDILDDPATRFMAVGGARITTEWSRVYDASWDLVGIQRLRHIMQFEGRYVTTFENTLNPDELFQYDVTDSRTRFDEVVFKMRHRFQTKVNDGTQLKTLEFLEIGVQIENYPDPDRDSVGFNATNYSSPFNWITLAPHDPSKALTERRYSNLHWDITLRPSKYFTGSAAGEYNPVHKQEEVREYKVGFTPSPTFSVAVEQVFIFDVTNAFTLKAQWQVTEKWKAVSDLQYDFKTGDFISRKMTLVRDFHDFLFEAIFEEDVGRDERKFYMTFVPSFLRLKK